MVRDCMRDYEVLIYARADSRTGIRPEKLQYRFYALRPG